MVFCSAYIESDVLSNESYLLGVGLYKVYYSILNKTRPSFRRG